MSEPTKPEELTMLPARRIDETPEDYAERVKRLIVEHARASEAPVRLWTSIRDLDAKLDNLDAEVAAIPARLEDRLKQAAALAVKEEFKRQTPGYLGTFVASLREVRQSRPLSIGLAVLLIGIASFPIGGGLWAAGLDLSSVDRGSDGSIKVQFENDSLNAETDADVAP